MPAKKKIKKKTAINKYQVIGLPKMPTSDQLRHAHKVLEYGIESVNSLFFRYMNRGKVVGAPLHVDQDLLRAMVVMAGTSLDATTKQLIKGSLPKLISINIDARDKSLEHIYRQVLRGLGDKGSRGKELAGALLSDSASEYFVQLIIDDITGDSLQNIDGLNKVAEYMGVRKLKDQDKIREAFETRNQIVHEMDAKTKGSGITRRKRKKDMMRRHAKNLLGAAIHFMKSVDAELIEAAKKGI